MTQDNKMYEQYKQILCEELIPSMGCTEPVALAYAAAKCRDILGCMPDCVRVQASGGIIKNVKSVYVPNTGGLKGIEAAIIAGIVAGDAEKKLEVINKVSQQQQDMMQHYLKEIDIKVEHLDEGHVFDMIVSLYRNDQQASVQITDSHTNIVVIKRNQSIIYKKDVNTEGDFPPVDHSVLSLENIWDFAATCQIDDLRALLDRQISYNMDIAYEGMQNHYGACIGATMAKKYGMQISNRAAAMAAAGSDARMAGCELPVIINSGSGNQGITCSVPVIVYAQELSVDENTLYRALILSNLTTIHLKTGIGCLSAFCGVVCAGVGAGAGITYLKGGGLKEVSHTVVNALAILSGMVCDGAKASCAAKIAFSVNAGILGSDMYFEGNQFKGGDGLVSKGVENTIRNIGRLGWDGMRETNGEIIRIMLNK